MSTNRETWPKASRWSRTGRPARYALALLLFLAGSGVAFTQSVLQEGPIRGRGLYFLYPNVLPYTRATYSGASAVVDVYYTEAAVSLERNWGSFQCSARELREIAFRGEQIFFLPASEEYSLFFVSTDVPPDFCSFVDRFLADFSYFRSTVGDREPVPFPAVVGIRQSR